MGERKREIERPPTLPECLTAASAAVSATAAAAAHMGKLIRAIFVPDY